MLHNKSQSSTSHRNLRKSEAAAIPRHQGYSCYQPTSLVHFDTFNIIESNELFITFLHSLHKSWVF